MTNNKHKNDQPPPQPQRVGGRGGGERNQCFEIQEICHGILLLFIVSISTVSPTPRVSGSGYVIDILIDSRYEHVLIERKTCV